MFNSNESGDKSNDKEKYEVLIMYSHFKPTINIWNGHFQGLYLNLDSSFSHGTFIAS